MFNINWQASQVALVVKTQPGSAGEPRDTSSNPGSGRSPGDKRRPTPVFLPGESRLQHDHVGRDTWTSTSGWGWFRVSWQVTVSGGQQRILAAGVRVFILPRRPSPAGCSLAWSRVPCAGHKGLVGHPCKIYSRSYA